MSAEKDELQFVRPAVVWHDVNGNRWRLTGAGTSGKAENSGRPFVREKCEEQPLEEGERTKQEPKLVSGPFVQRVLPEVDARRYKVKWRKRKHRTGIQNLSNNPMGKKQFSKDHREKARSTITEGETVGHYLV